MEGKPATGDTRIVEEIVDVDGSKMKKLKKYEQKLVKEYIPKGVLARQKLQPFNVEKGGEASRLDKNPVFFEIHGKGKQIKVKVDTSRKINQELKEIERAIEGEKVRIRELDEEQNEVEFGRRYQVDRTVDENAVVRVSNIPDSMSNYEIRNLFSQYGKIIMLTMPKPVAVTDEQKKIQHRIEKRQRKHDKKMKGLGFKAEVSEEVKKVEPETERTHRGFAYIYYEDPASAAQSIKELNDQAFYSQIISVKKARPRGR
ncbi:MAG: RNA-binding protein [Candidatus Pacebacteria bacterium]|nr:RNA-binding protein [Candidatus Paceibacterota bacterium]